MGFAAGPFDATVTFDEGGTERARLVVAADGRRSALREAAGIKIVGWEYGQTGIVATVAHERPHDGVAVQHFLPAGPFAILPLVGNRSCITWSEDAAAAGDEVDLARDNALQALQAAEAQPDFVAERALLPLVYGDHPYARTEATAASIAAITRAVIFASAIRNEV